VSRSLAAFQNVAGNFGASDFNEASAVADPRSECGGDNLMEICSPLSSIHGDKGQFKELCMPAMHAMRYNLREAVP